MLKLNSDIDRPDTVKYFYLMDRDKSVYIDKLNYESDVAKQSAIKENAERMMIEYMCLMGAEKPDKFTRNVIRDFLLNVEKVPENAFKKSDSDSVHFDQEIVQRIIEKEYSPILMEMYKDWQKVSNVADNGQSLMGGLIETKKKSRAGVNLYKAPFFYGWAATKRIYTNSANLQAVAYEYLNDFRAPEDYYYLWFDFSQIDLRVALEICLKEKGSLLEDYLEKYKDRYEVFARYMSDEIKHEFNYEEFKKNRPKYKQVTLSPIYGAGVYKMAQKVGGDIEFCKHLHRFINNQPKYIKYAKLMKDNQALGLPFYCETYFHTRLNQSPQNPKCYTQSLNKPIQGTSADIMQIITVEVYDRVQKHIKDFDKFHPILNRHDENVMLVHKDVIPYLYEFVNCTEIQVDDWGLLDLDWDIGEFYKVPNDELKDQILASCVGKMTKVDKTKRKSKYSPAPVPLETYWCTFNYHGKYFNFICDYYNQVAHFEISDKDLKIEDISKIMLDKWGKVYKEKGYTRIVLVQRDSSYFGKFLSNELEFMTARTNDNLNDYNPMTVMYGLAVRYLTRVMKLSLDDIPEEAVAMQNIQGRKAFDLTIGGV